MHPLQNITHHYSLSHTHQSPSALSLDICIPQPDDKVVFLYVSSLFNILPHSLRLDLSSPDSDKTSLTCYSLRTGSRTPSKSTERQMVGFHDRSSATLPAMTGSRGRLSSSPSPDMMGRKSIPIRRSGSADTVVLKRVEQVQGAIRPAMRSGSVKVSRCR